MRCRQEAHSTPKGEPRRSRSPSFSRPNQALLSSITIPTPLPPTCIVTLQLPISSLDPLASGVRPNFNFMNPRAANQQEAAPRIGCWLAWRLAGVSPQRKQPLNYRPFFLGVCDACHNITSGSKDAWAWTSSLHSVGPPLLRIDGVDTPLLRWPIRRLRCGWLPVLGRWCVQRDFHEPSRR